MSYIHLYKCLLFYSKMFKNIIYKSREVFVLFCLVLFTTHREIITTSALVLASFCSPYADSGGSQYCHRLFKYYHVPTQLVELC